MNFLKFESLSNELVKWLETSGIKLLIAVIILYIGWMVINRVVKKAINILKNKNFDATVASFLEAFIDIALKIILIIFLLGYIGFNLAGLAAILASAGLALGLALQGSLSNLAGGFIILILRPFKVGDYISTDSYSGKVNKIQIFYTHLLTSDNKEVMIPNGKLANGNIVNYSSQEKRRVDLTFGIGYEDNLLKAKNILIEIVNEHELILDLPQPFVAVSEQAASSVNFIVKAWCNNSDYWKIYYDLLETVKLRFDKENISIPFNQMDIHIKQD